MTTAIRVVSALILNDAGEMLMALRKPDAIRPSLWEHPGGKVEDGEYTADAIQRELREELDVGVTMIDYRIGRARVAVEVDLVVELYPTTIVGDPRPLASVELRWVTPLYAIQHLPCTPATYGFYRDVVGYLALRKAKEVES